MCKDNRRGSGKTRRIARARLGWILSVLRDGGAQMFTRRQALDLLTGNAVCLSCPLAPAKRVLPAGQECQERDHEGGNQAQSGSSSAACRGVPYPDLLSSG